MLLVNSILITRGSTLHCCVLGGAYFSHTYSLAVHAIHLSARTHEVTRELNEILCWRILLNFVQSFQFF
jgi:hypothetical protein